MSDKRVGWVDPYTKILIIGQVIYESAHKKHVNIAIAV